MAEAVVGEQMHVSSGLLDGNVAGPSAVDEGAGDRRDDGNGPRGPHGVAQVTKVSVCVAGIKGCGETVCADIVVAIRQRAVGEGAWPVCAVIVAAATRI